MQSTLIFQQKIPPQAHMSVLPATVRLLRQVPKFTPAAVNRSCLKSGRYKNVTLFTFACGTGSDSRQCQAIGIVNDTFVPFPGLLCTCRSPPIFLANSRAW